jgi:hypothetical protein
MGANRISCHAAPNRPARAPFREERRIKFVNTTKFYRKSGEPNLLNTKEQLWAYSTP